MYGKIFVSMYDGTISANWKAMITFQQLFISCELYENRFLAITTTAKSLSSKTSIPEDILIEGFNCLANMDEYSLCKGINAKSVSIILYKKNQITVHIILHQTPRLSGEQWDKLRRIVFNRDNYTCFYCKERGGILECDHVLPLSRGGSNDVINLVSSCVACNRSKGRKTVGEWLQ